MPPEVVDRDDGRVVHLRDDLGLALEALLGVLREVPRRDELHRDVAVEDGILRAVDDTHPAPSELGEDLVSVGELRADHVGMTLFICLRLMRRMILEFPEGKWRMRRRKSRIS